MFEQFNLLNRAFGAHRVSLLDVRQDLLVFRIEYFGDFAICLDGSVVEVTTTGLSGKGEFYRFESRNSRWIQGISLGGKRDDNGNMIFS